MHFQINKYEKRWMIWYVVISISMTKNFKKYILEYRNAVNNDKSYRGLKNSLG